MPHFIVDCSEEILAFHSIETILKYLHQVANHTKLFEESDIKVRINPFKTSWVGNKKQPFIHVFAHIMEGRTDDEKNTLSTSMVKRLSIMFPDVESISMSIVDLHKVGYVNLAIMHGATVSDPDINDGKSAIKSEGKPASKADKQPESADKTAV
ncbi:5-carboxymethyl-2-hydroxymuconate Delta-isomerase [Shewanella sp. SR44-3]|uniref:5-carboxymethyl-2-hydroxymuconate Delta-isomerase n=1 Tax=unclassified Shewanella TaxID=196818 RepID=UPI0015F95FB2|nr:5-carboxymethyl-2-hydroxymuconate Delta-isomerase [Shewanella sp. SR44-3]MBB1267822.1 5-carboxymethyl-2-hydroxymuconate Delta-isomerase [Shewanella sp. SR44-3]